MKTIIYSLVALFILSSCEKRKEGAILTKEETALTEKVHFNPAVLLKLREYTDAPLKQFVTSTYEYDPARKQDMFVKNYNHAVVFALPKDKSSRLSKEMQPWLTKKGYVVFTSYDSFGKDNDSIAILKTRDQFDILRTVGTASPDYDLYNKAIIATLYKWSLKYPFIITGAGQDWVQAEFIKQPADMEAFAKEVYAFCPDIVDQGSGDIEALAKEMKDNNMLYLWWD